MNFIIEYLTAFTRENQGEIMKKYLSLFHPIRTITSILLLMCSTKTTTQLRLIVIRHGESTHNIDQVYNANRNHPNYKPSFLTAKGINAVEESCKSLTVLGIRAENVIMSYVSPLPRTIQTAAFLVKHGIINPQKLTIDDRLIDDNPGEKEGKSIIGENNWDHSKAHDYGGENDADVTARVSQLLHEVKNKYQNGDIILISHGTPIGLLLNVCFNKNSKLGQDPEITLPTAGFKIITLES